MLWYSITSQEAGNQSQDKKRARMKALLVAATDCEPLYLVRLLQVTSSLTFLTDSLPLLYVCCWHITSTILCGSRVLHSGAQHYHSSFCISFLDAFFMLNLLCCHPESACLNFISCWREFFCYALKQHLLGSLQRSFHFFVGLHLT
jgi:hypothetical protein